MSWGKNDIGEEKLAKILKESQSPDLVLELVGLSRKHFGWYVRHLPRSVEYPWVLKQIGDVRGKTILDIGAGVSPLPLYLAERGAKVVTLDSSTNIRELSQDRKSWNEWGFLDYAQLDQSITSLNKDALSVKFDDATFDCIYSVSAIEHMPASTRKRLWRHFGEWLKAQGSLVLTVDLHPNSQSLWNYTEGKPIESKMEHGDTYELLQEITQEKFQLVATEYLRRHHDSPVDVLLLSLTKR